MRLESPKVVQNSFRYSQGRAMLIDCPHCFTRVVPKSNGLCPACQKDMRDTTRLDLARASIRVSQGDVLPKICCDCGETTSRVVKVYQKHAAKEQPSSLAATLIFLLSSWAMGSWLFLRGMAETSVAEVAMPQCERCARRGDPKPRYVDFSNARMTFVVHRNLKEAMTH